MILAALGSDIAVAGLVLVFAGFLATKAESFEEAGQGISTVGWQWQD